jgi:hypothetical protein
MAMRTCLQIVLLAAMGATGIGFACAMAGIVAATVTGAIETPALALAGAWMCIGGTVALALSIPFLAGPNGEPAEPVKAVAGLLRQGRRRRG